MGNLLSLTSNNDSNPVGVTGVSGVTGATGQTECKEPIIEQKSNEIPVIDDTYLDDIKLLSMQMWNDYSCGYLIKDSFVGRCKRYTDLNPQYEESIVLSYLEQKVNAKHINFVIDVISADVKCRAIKNLSIYGIDQNNIKTVELIIGGQCIDKIDGNIMNTLRKLYDIKDEHIIPFYISSNLYIPIFNGGTKIEVNIKLKNLIEKQNEDNPIELKAEYHSVNVPESYTVNGDLLHVSRKNAFVVETPFYHIENFGKDYLLKIDTQIDNIYQLKIYSSDPTACYLIKFSDTFYDDNQLNSLELVFGTHGKTYHVSINSICKMDNVYVVRFVPSELFDFTKHNNFGETLEYLVDNRNAVSITAFFHLKNKLSKDTEVKIYAISVNSLSTDGRGFSTKRLSY